MIAWQMMLPHLLGSTISFGQELYRVLSDAVLDLHGNHLMIQFLFQDLYL